MGELKMRCLIMSQFRAACASSTNATERSFITLLTTIELSVPAVLRELTEGRLRGLTYNTDAGILIGIVAFDRDRPGRL